MLRLAITHKPAIHNHHIATSSNIIVCHSVEMLPNLVFRKPLLHLFVPLEHSAICVRRQTTFELILKDTKAAKPDCS